LRGGSVVISTTCAERVLPAIDRELFDGKSAKSKDRVSMATLLWILAVILVVAGIVAGAGLREAAR
jgi:hypothetical protein